MPRLAAWSVFLLGIACVAYGPAALTAQNQKDDKKKVDDKKAPPKVDDKKAPPKVEPKAQPPKAEPKPADPPAGEPEPLPLDGPPSPLDLVRGLRQEGLSDLAVELIGDLEKNAKLPPAVKSELPLERARCLLDAADDEPDEATRLSLVGEAKDGFATFLKNTPGHPRAAEAYLSLARLTSLEAKAQVAKSKRVDVPGEGEAGRDAALKKQRDEAAAARPLFLGAARQFKSAADKIGTQLAAGVPDPAVRRSLIQSKTDALLASGVNQMYLGDTYVDATAAEKKERSEAIDKARIEFNALIAEKETTARVAWVAKAWIAECEYQKDNNKVAEAKFQEVVTATGDSEDGKRVARFFLIRHKVIEQDGKAVEKDSRDWLSKYGANRRAAGEAVAVRWYLASVLQAQGDQLAAPAKGAKQPSPIPAGAATKYREAEKLYRTIAQADNEYSFRAAKRRMYVVRRLLGDAEAPPASYRTFEEAQMASLIQIAKLMDQEKAERPGGDEGAKKHDAALKARRLQVVALLEHCREIATPADNAADVTEVLLRLIYFYQQVDQPQRAAILAEYLARQVRAAGGKSAAGGMLGVGAYTRAATTIRLTDPAEIDAARRADRDRAISLARFLDDRFPNDPATDAARHQLAGLLYQDGKTVDAYDAALKVRPGYDRLAYLRLFQGAIASQLLAGKDSPLPDARRVDVYRRTVADLEKLPAPAPSADEDDAKTYLTVRARLAFLYLIQNRTDPEAEKGGAGFGKAIQIAEDAIKEVGNYKSLMAGGKGLNLDGWEARLAAEDARTRAVYLESQALFVAGKYDEVFGSAGKILVEMNEKGPIAAAAKAAEGDDPAQRTQVEKLAAGVDKLRADLVVVTLKTRVRQGQAEKGVELLDLLKRFGGSIEANVRTLEQLTVEMSAQIDQLRRTGKAADAQAMADGFGKLLEKVSAEPNLPASVQLFLGQALIVVGEYEKAAAALARVPRPATMTPPPTADDATRRGVGEFRRATLDLARARRMGKKYDDAEKMLKDAMGEKDKQGWAFSSLDYRKEWNHLHEARGADEKDAKAAQKHWGVAVKGWTEILTITRNRLTGPPPKTMAGEIDNNAVQKGKNAFYDAYLDYNRCVLKANMQLLAADPGKVQSKVDDTAKRVVELEQKEGPHMYTDVKARFHDVISDIPALRKSYEAAGGKLFLQAPTEN